MKKFLFSLCLLSASFSLVSAQTGGRIFGAQQLVLDDNNPTHPKVYLSNLNGSMGIDNTGVTSAGFPNPCSLLDLSSTTKGFLPPRMSVGQELAMCGGVPPEGMLVYNTTSHSFDMYNGTAWVSAGGGGGATTGWALVGNSGTNPVTNFLGTIDGQDLVIRTTNSERLRVLATGNVGIGDPSPASLLTVGNGDKFQVNSTGDVVALKGVSYSWPLANATGVLTNNGTGTLTWAVASSATGWNITGNNGTDPETNFLGTIDGKDLVVRTTNSERLRVLATGNFGVGVQSPASLFSVGALSKFQVNSSGDLVAIKGVSYLWPGANAAGVLTNNGTGTLSWTAPVVVNAWNLVGNSGTNTLTNFLGTTDARPMLIRTTNAERVRVTATGNVGIGDSTPVSLLTVGNGDKFQVNTNGNLIAINGVPYSWPASNAGGVLTNDASGNLSWAAASGGSGGWSLTGDASTTAGTNFIGTTDDQPFEIHVFQSDNKNKGSMRVMLYEPKDSSVNITGGYQYNSINLFNRGSVIAGGGEDQAVNFINADFSFIGGGINNRISGGEGIIRNSVIIGGIGNIVTASYGAIVGGGGNNVYNNYAFIGGGLGNFATGSGSFVGGGGFDGESSAGNFASGSGSAIVGGTSNSASGFGSFVGGGNSNSANNTYTGIVGGVFNNANGYTAAVGGGYQNNAIGDYSTISGGNFNVANGNSSVIGGGSSNFADGSNAMVLGGIQASAQQYAQFAQSSGAFASTGDAQTSVFVLRNITTDGVTPTSLFLDGALLELSLPNNNTVYTFHIMVTGICTSTPGLYVGYDMKGLIYRDNAGVVNFIGAPPVATLLAGNIGGVSFTVAADNINKALDLKVIGRATQTIRWVARVETVEASF